jgi:hypothetical protein
MVETVIDPIRMPTVTLSQAEMDDIASGQLPPEWLERYHAAVQSNVFGHNHKSDRHGNPIEQGRGSAQNMTQQSVDAYKKWGKDEPDYADNLKRMQAQLDACNEVRNAATAARRKEVGGRR